MGGVVWCDVDRRGGLDWIGLGWNRGDVFCMRLGFNG